MKLSNISSWNNFFLFILQLSTGTIDKNATLLNVIARGGFKYTTLLVTIIAMGQSWDSFIFIFEFPILVRPHLYIESAPWCRNVHRHAMKLWWPSSLKHECVAMEHCVKMRTLNISNHLAERRSVSIHVCHVLFAVHRGLRVSRDLLKRMTTRLNIHRIIKVSHRLPSTDPCSKTLRPRQNCRNLADDISNAFSWMKIYDFRLRFHWSLFLRFEFTILQHWFR